MKLVISIVALTVFVASLSHAEERKVLSGKIVRTCGEYNFVRTDDYTGFVSGMKVTTSQFELTGTQGSPRYPAILVPNSEGAQFFIGFTEIDYPVKARITAMWGDFFLEVFNADGTITKTTCQKIK